MFCQNCGTEIKENSNFCLNCGKALSETTGNYIKTDNDDAQNAKVNEKVISKKQKNTGWVLIGIGILYLLTGIITSFDKSLSYIESEIATIAFGILLGSYGVILMKKRIRKFGWGIPAAISASIVIDACVPFEKWNFLGGMVLSVVFACLLLKANIKNKGE